MSNRAEAAAVVRLVSRLRAAGVRPGSIGVICFFRAQVGVVRRLLLENQARQMQTQAQERPVAVAAAAAAAGAEEAGEDGKAKEVGEEAGQEDEKGGDIDGGGDDDDDQIPTVATVDSYQGCEKDLIIITTAATRPSAFTRDAHRVNVAVTRARRHLVVVGHGGALVAAAAGGGGCGGEGRAGKNDDANALGSIVRACTNSPGGVLEMV